MNYLIQESKKINYPTDLMILLHGYGSNPSDLFFFVKDFPTSMLIVSIQAPISLLSGGFSWYEINLSEKKISNLKQAKYSQQLIIKFIENLSEKYLFNKNNIWLCGFSQGAILSYSLMLNYPEQFKKGILLSGYLDLEMINQKYKSYKYENSEVFISHGIKDNIIPITWIRNTSKLLTTLGIKTTYREYESSHEINQDNYKDMINWIYQRI